ELIWCLAVRRVLFRSSWKPMNTWLSGMSPVAAEFASACSGDGAALVVVWIDCVAEPLVVGLVSVGPLLLLEPQPTSGTTAANTKTTTRAGIGIDGRLACLNGA